MIRLSRRAWNNVIIFTMLIMIILFNSTHNILTGSVDDESQVVPLLSPDAVLMSLEFGNQKIERIGRGWRLTPPSNLSESELADIIAHWHQAELVPDELPASVPPLVVVAWLAGQPHGRVFQYYLTDQALFVKVESQLYKVINKNQQQLMLPGVF